MTEILTRYKEKYRIDKSGNIFISRFLNNDIGRLNDYQIRAERLRLYKSIPQKFKGFAKYIPVVADPQDRSVEPFSEKPELCTPKHIEFVIDFFDYRHINYRLDEKGNLYIPYNLYEDMYELYFHTNYAEERLGWEEEEKTQKK